MQGWELGQVAISDLQVWHVNREEMMYFLCSVSGS